MTMSLQGDTRSSWSTRKYREQVTIRRRNRHQIASVRRGIDISF
jgi:hypothetical protein